MKNRRQYRKINVFLPFVCMIAILLGGCSTAADGKSDPGSLLQSNPDPAVLTPTYDVNRNLNQSIIVQDGYHYFFTGNKLLRISKEPGSQPTTLYTLGDDKFLYTYTGNDREILAWVSNLQYEDFHLYRIPMDGTSITIIPWDVDTQGGVEKFRWIDGQLAGFHSVLTEQWSMEEQPDHWYETTWYRPEGDTFQIDRTENSLPAQKDWSFSWETVPEAEGLWHHIISQISPTGERIEAFTSTNVAPGLENFFTYRSVFTKGKNLDYKAALSKDSDYDLEKELDTLYCYDTYDQEEINPFVVTDSNGSIAEVEALLTYDEQWIYGIGNLTDDIRVPGLFRCRYDGSDYVRSELENIVHRYAYYEVAEGWIYNTKEGYRFHFDDPEYVEVLTEQ